MTENSVPQGICLSVDDACRLSIEYWRLRSLSENVTDSAARAPLKRSIRCIGDALAKLGLEVIDLTGRKYDPGMAPEVIDVEGAKKGSLSAEFIVETITPTVMWRGIVAHSGQIVVGSKEPSSSNRSKA